MSGQISFQFGFLFCFSFVLAFAFVFRDGNTFESWRFL